MTMTDVGRDTLDDVLLTVKDGMTVDKVFGEPLERG